MMDASASCNPDRDAAHGDSVRKLGAKRRTEAVTIGLRRGLVLL